MITTEPTLKGRFVVYVYPKPLDYGFDNKNKTRSELYQRVKMLLGNEKMTPRQVRRPIYPMQLGGYLKSNILQMVTDTATSLYQEYTAINMPSGSILYIEETDNELYIFVLSPGSSVGFSQLCNLV